MPRVADFPEEMGTSGPNNIPVQENNAVAGHLQLFTAASAEEFYRNECCRNNVNPNNTFVRQLLAGATIFDFDNGYLGGRGIVPILSTLQRLAVVELSMRSCELSAEDIALLHKTFASHKTLRKIDLRGVFLPVASARRLLALAVENPKVTEICIDENTPKYLYIQRQCSSNANASMAASRCLVCGKPVIHSPDQRVEGRVLLALGEEFASTPVANAGVQLQVIFRCILACCEANDGVLFLCSAECRSQLTSDIGTSMQAIQSEWPSGVKATQPKNSILRRCVADMLRTHDSNETGHYEVPHRIWSTTDKDEDSISSGGERNDMKERCTVCGTFSSSCLPNGPHLVMRQICRDIEGSSNGTLSPSAMMRLAKLMIQYVATLRVCSKKCVRALVRFGEYGFGGVLRAQPSMGDPPVSTIGIPMRTFPDEDFAIINFSATQADDMEEEDTCCALTVASAMTDIEGVTIDPYIIFAVARHLANLPPFVLGVELRFACEAVRFIGCLPVSMAPFDRRRERPVRRDYVSWSDWGEHADVESLVRIAFSRRRQCVYVVDGMFGNLFDNTSAVLWAFRQQQRAVLVSMKFCVEWLSVPEGVLPNEMTPKRGFLTTLKVVGRSNINNSHYLICQGNFGSRVGNRGFFYIPRGLFNLHTVGDAYIFLDSGTISVNKGMPLPLYAERVLTHRIVKIAEQIAILQEVYRVFVEILSWKRRGRVNSVRILREALQNLPPALFFAFQTCEHDLNDAQRAILEDFRRVCFNSGTRSQRLFILNEILGPPVLQWIAELLPCLTPLTPLILQRQRKVTSMKTSSSALMYPPAAFSMRRVSRMEWKPLDTARRLLHGDTLALQQQTQKQEQLQSQQRLLSQQKRISTQQVGRKLEARRSGRRSEKSERANKETRDTFRTHLEQQWSCARDELKAQRIIQEQQRRPGSSLRARRRSAFSARAMAQGGETVPLPLLNKSWQAVRLCDEDGNLGEAVMLFIADHACCFNLTNQTVEVSLHSMRTNASMGSFPFSTGFDCVMNSPMNPRVAYFFSGELWLEWDTYRQTCISGPHRISQHRQFESLPVEFHNGIDAAVPVPGRSHIFFFAQLHYVLFDLTNLKPVGGTRRIDPRTEKVNTENVSSETGVPKFSSSLVDIFPHGPMVSLLTPQSEKNSDMNRRKSEGDKRKKVDNYGSSSSSSNALAVMLIGRDGRVVIIKHFADVPVLQHETIPTSILARLPLVFRQMTTVALSTVSTVALTAECAMHDCYAIPPGTVTSSNIGGSGSGPIAMDFGSRCTVTVKSTLQQKREDTRALLALAPAGAALLCDEAVFVQTPETELDGPHPYLVTDFGKDGFTAFGALVIILDTSHVDERLLRIAPPEAIVESSDDGVVFVCHARFVLTPSVTVVCWGEAHAARFWQLRILNRLPAGTGVVRLLWHEVGRAQIALPLDPTVPFAPIKSVAVSIAAPRLLRDAKCLLDNASVGAVFASPRHGEGWRERHCILPLLPGPSCLFFCGDNFVELDGKGTVVSQRAVNLRRHPAFAALPYPFNLGFDAIFYPLQSNPNIVALLHAGQLLHWNLDTGSAENGVNSSYLNGLPWGLEDVDTIVHLWDQPGEILIVRSPFVVLWNLAKGELMNGPMPLRDCPQLYSTHFDSMHNECDNATMLSAVSMPHAPNIFYVFVRDHVVVNTVDSNSSAVQVNSTTPFPVCHFDSFSMITWYLSWGKLRHDCIVRLDFREEQPLFAGLIMRSSEPTNGTEEWLIEYSDDGIDWHCVGFHRQSSVCSRTMWSLSSVSHCSHRLWRLSLSEKKVDPILMNKDKDKTNSNHTSNSNGYGDGDKKNLGKSPKSFILKNAPSLGPLPVLYADVCFLTLLSAPYRMPPRSIALSGTLNGPASSLFIDERATIAFEKTSEEDDTGKDPVPHHISLDFGANPPDLMGFECRCTAEWVSDVWSVWCSDDGEEWENCGLWRSRFSSFKVSWKPCGPRRYWRLELQSSNSNVVYEQFSFFEYIGPSVSLENATTYGDGWDASLLWEKTASRCNISPMIFSTQVGSSIIIDTKRYVVPVIGIKLISHEQRNTSTRFALEYSIDAVDWNPLNESFLLRDGSAQVAWDSPGCYRYWRMRILQHTGPASLMLRDICLSISRPSLYRAIGGPSGESKSDLIIKSGLEEVVAAQAVLPPGARYAVEKLSLDGITWEMIAMLQNKDTRHHRTVRQGWTPQGSSCRWRLRVEPPEEIVSVSVSLNVTQQQQQQQQQENEKHLNTCVEAVVPNIPVQWFVFAGKKFLLTDFSKNRDVQVVATGFDEAQAARRLTANSEAVVLRSICEANVASVAWFFMGDVAPRFHQVFIRGRTAPNPNAPLPPASPSPPPPPLQPPQEEKKTSSHNTSKRRRVKVETPEIVESVVVEEKFVPLRVIVEISGNGVDYVPVADRMFAQVSNSLSWKMRVAAPYWRIRFTGIPKSDFLELWHVAWLVESGVPSATWLQTPYQLSNPMYDTWLQEAFNDEDGFCRRCREGYDQCKSVASGLREPEDIERHGILAQRVSKMRSDFTLFAAKVSKDASKDSNPPLDKFISIGRPLSNDVMYLLHRCAQRYNCNVNELNDLIAHPMLFGQDFAREKEGLTWFYPRFEESGTLVESFYGFQKIQASMSVWWSLSLQLQFNTDEIKNPAINPLSPHLASVLVVVNVEQNNWLAAEHFPGLPLLYHVGFSERPVVIAFALNQITFTSTYNLKIPGAEPFTAVYPFKLLPGANFIRRMSLTSCPCPVFDRLALIYSSEFLLKYETEIVFTAPSMNSNKATVRFTLPGDGINFSIQGLSVESIEFEVTLTKSVDESILPILDMSSRIPHKRSLSPHRMTFVTHNAIFTDLTGKNDPLSLSLTGCVSEVEDSIAMTGLALSARWKPWCCFLDAFFTDLQFSFELISGEAPQTFLEPLLSLDAALVTPRSGTYACCIRNARLSQGFESFTIKIATLQLAEFIKLGDYLLATSSRVEQTDWLEGLPIYISAELQLAVPPFEFRGRGFLDFGDVRGDAFVSVAHAGIGITASLPTVRLGGISLCGAPPNGFVAIYIAASPLAPCIVRLDGNCHLIAPQPCPACVEIAKSGTLCISSGPLYDVFIEEDALFLSGSYAQVSISGEAIIDGLSQLLQRTPMISSLLAKGMPFSFLVQEVVVDTCLLERQMIILSVRGVLFGYQFDIMATVIRPANTIEEAQCICRDLVPLILEQCDEPLWASYEMFVGCFVREKVSSSPNMSDAEVEEGTKEKGGTKKEANGEKILREESIDDVLVRHHATVAATEGQFLSNWLVRECEAMEGEINEDWM